MLTWIRRGTIPDKPHTALFDETGALLYEHCFTRRGFDGPYSILYQQNKPQAHRARPAERTWTKIEAARHLGSHIERRHLRAPELVEGDSIATRRPLLFNRDLVVERATPSLSDAQYFCNADGDELIYVQTGGGKLISPFGELRFGKECYLVVPKGVVHRFELDNNGASQDWLLVELRGGLSIPAAFRNPTGQLRMDAPYSLRDFAVSEFRGVMDEALRRILIKRDDTLHEIEYSATPLDAVGFEGALYPFALPIRCFQPRVSSVHLPPSVHATFEAPGVLVCSFVPRPLDFHPQAVRCPYPHSSVDVDEVIFYSDGQFTSREDVGVGSITWHPRGTPHGPHSDTYETSFGKQATDELAVMLDCNEPLQLTTHGARLLAPNYDESFSK